jgi:predicted transcriptional regulator
VEVNADLREREEDLRLLLTIEEAIFRAIGRIDTLTDVEVSVALADLHAHFSPLELIAHPPSLLGRFLFEHIDREIEGDIAAHERVREILPRMKKMVEMLRDPEVSKGRQGPRGGLILTPGDLGLS